MTDPQRLLELVQGDLDGTLTAADKAELARILLQDPAARRLHDEFRRTEALLLELPRAEPPADLRSAVLEALQLPESHSGGGRGARGGVGVRLAAAVVTGLVVVGLGYGLLSERRETAALQGSVATAARSSAALQARPGEVAARLEASDTGSRLVLDAPAGEAQVLIRFDPARLACHPAAGDDAWSSPAQGEWILAQTGHPARHALDCTGEGTLRMETWSAGQTLDAASLTLPP